MTDRKKQKSDTIRLTINGVTQEFEIGDRRTVFVLPRLQSKFSRPADRVAGHEGHAGSGRAAGIAGDGGIGQHQFYLIQRDASRLGGHLLEDGMRPLPHIRTGMVHHDPLDLRLAVDLDRGPGVFGRAEGKAHVLKAAGEAQAALDVGVNRLF